MGAVENIAFPTVMAWPAGADDDSCITLLTSTGLIDAYTARRMLMREPPMILGGFSLDASSSLVTAINSSGAEAFSPTLQDIASLGPSLRFTNIELKNGDFELTLAAGPTTVLRRKQIQFLVRASVRCSAESDRNKRIAKQVRDSIGERTRLHTHYGFAIRQAAKRAAESYESHSIARDREILDLHTTDGAIYQANGDRFSFGILGQLRGHADKPNMDALCELVAHVATEDVVDTYFNLFRPPPLHERLIRLVPDIRRNGEDPGFAFYSRWAALVYRRVLQGPPGGDPRT